MSELMADNECLVRVRPDALSVPEEFRGKTGTVCYVSGPTDERRTVYVVRMADGVRVPCFAAEIEFIDKEVSP